MTDIRLQLEALVPDLGDSEWDALVNRSYVDDVEIAGGSIDKLAEHVREERERWRPQPNRSAERAEPAADPAELARRASTRAEALAALLAVEAGEREDVDALRRDVLRGKLLKPERVGPWIRKRTSSEESIRHLVLGPRSEPGAEKINGHPVVRYESPTLTFVEYPKGSSDGGFVATAISVPGLERLRRLSEALARDYGWQPALATEFILTGRVPILPPIRCHVEPGAEHSGTTRIVLSADVTVTGPEVRARFESERRRLLAGRRTRRMSTKHLTLGIFARTHEAGSWTERMGIWNAEFPEWRYGDQRNFSRDANSALRRLLDPLG